MTGLGVAGAVLLLTLLGLVLNAVDEHRTPPERTTSCGGGCSCRA